MKKKISVILTAMVFMLGAVGTAGAQGVTPQTLLQGALIPQFVDPLPVAGITVIDARPGGALASYNINLQEFQAQILPSTFVPPGLPVGTVAPIPSWVWGYLTDADVTGLGTNPVRPSYLGPIVLATRDIQTNPTYFNNLPNFPTSNVQVLLPIDQTLDWADPAGTGCVGSPPPVTGTCASIYLGPQPAVPHIHGGEVAPAYDGGPDAWWTPGVAQKGVGFSSTTFQYPNKQQAGTIWFHDHALGITRLNVYAGMAGVHIITDPANEPPKVGDTGCINPALGCLPNAAYDIPLIIQDRSFDTTGQLFYNLASNPQPNPTVHPFWIPEFIGDTIVVNGKTWPYLNVEARKYRFRLVNGSNARFYDLTLSYTTGGGRRGKTASLPFTVIATDDGYLDAPQVTPNVIIAPGERYEVIVDFTGLAGINNIIMKNSARTPFPGGARPVTGTTDTVMQFRVIAAGATPDPVLPTNLRPNNPIVRLPGTPLGPAIVTLSTAANKNVQVIRQLTLNEVIGPGGPLELVLNNTKYNGIVPSSLANNTNTTRDSEQPQVGATELWEIINITADAHPIHTHLASFQVVSRQGFQAAAWTNVYAAQLLATYGPPSLVCPTCPDGEGPPLPYLPANADGAIGGNPAIGPYLQAKRLTLPLAYEQGWKDTAISYPGEVMRIMIRWSPTEVLVPNGVANACAAQTPLPTCASSAGVNLYPFVPTTLIGGVGYVWHCHIIDHEDNEMMRPYVVSATPQWVMP